MWWGMMAALLPWLRGAVLKVGLSLSKIGKKKYYCSIPEGVEPLLQSPGPLYTCGLLEIIVGQHVANK